MIKSSIRLNSLLFISIFFLGSLSLFAQNKLDENGKKTGPWRGTYKDGKLRYIGQFKADIPIDTFTYYYPKGAMKMLLVWLNEKESYATMYYENGEKMAEGKYLDKKKAGIWVTYGANENKVNEGNYISGKKYEMWRVFYTNGKVSEEVEFIADLENGPYKSYFESGEIQQEAIFVDGYRQGKTTVYYPDGQVKVKGQYEKGARDGVWIYYNEDGTILKEIEFDLGKRVTPFGEDEILEDTDLYKDKVKEELEYEDMQGTIKYDTKRK